MHPLLGIVSFAAMAAVVLAVTAVVCKNRLKEQPANLLITKAPKAGKKIFLERIGFFWKHLSFKYKSSKGSISFTYDKDGRVVKQSNGLEFIYDQSGIAGIKYNNATYFYRKDGQGNIAAILDSNGNVVVEYKYDSWGNHAVLYWNKVDNEEKYSDEDDAAFDENYERNKTLAKLNPFRYRGYYYDTETGLYFLKTRYYDPEVGRFITIDSISYIDPETINGLNLYAYCGNNPVMGYDPDGTWDWGRFWAGLLIGLVTIAAVALTVVTFGTGSIAGGIIIGATIGAAGSMFSQTVIEGKSFSEINFLQVGLGALTGALCAIPGVGLIGGTIISGVSGIVSARIDGASWENALISGLWSAATALVAGIVLRGIGMAKISKIGKGNYAGKKVFLNHTGLKGLKSFSPAINKTTSLLKYIYSNVGLRGLSKLTAQTAGFGMSLILDIITALLP